MWETKSMSSEKNGNENTNDTTSIEAAQEEENVVRINENGDSCLTEQEKREKKAFYKIKELISSEKVFIDVLKLLTEDFVEYVKSVDRDNPVIPESELMKIIHYLPPLRSFNEELLGDFESRFANWSSYPKISDIMIKKGPFLKLFSTCIQNYTNQCALLNDCCFKYPRFGKAVKNFEMSERCKRLSLKHYMLKPVQRLPQYRLFLEGYLEQQTSESIDYEDTQGALNIVCDAVKHADRCVGQEISLKKLLQLQVQLGSYEIIKPGREFIKSGELSKLSRKEVQQRFFILLNDCLLYMSSMFSLKVTHELPLAGMKVYSPMIEDDNSNEFNITSRTKSFILRASSSDEREEWVSALETTIREYNRKRLSFSSSFDLIDPSAGPLKIGIDAPIMVQDVRVTMCQVCTDKFTLLFRRHHCRACGKVVCSNCSYKEAPLQYLKFQTARVCDDCYKHLKEEYTGPNSSIMKYIMKQSDMLSGKDPTAVYNDIKASFKEHYPPRMIKIQHTRCFLYETPKDSDSICSWLHLKTRKSWKRKWFKLKEQVLFVYKASEDRIASKKIVVLGYEVETFREVRKAYEDIDSKLMFQLTHVNQDPWVFYADTEAMADKWITALKKAVSI